MTLKIFFTALLTFMMSALCIAGPVDEAGLAVTGEHPRLMLRKGGEAAILLPED